MSQQVLEEILSSQMVTLIVMRGIAAAIERIEVRLLKIERTLTHMTTREQFDAALQTLLQKEAERDAAVTKALTDLMAKVTAGNVTPEDFVAELAVVTTLQNNAAAITQTATADDPGTTDVSNPPAPPATGDTSAATTSATTTKVTGPSTAPAGTDVQLQVVVSGSAATPTGDVALADAAGNPISGCTLDSEGKGVLVVAQLPAGTNSYTAKYAGDAANAASVADPLVIVAQ